MTVRVSRAQITQSSTVSANAAVSAGWSYILCRASEYVSSKVTGRVRKADRTAFRLILVERESRCNLARRNL